MVKKIARRYQIPRELPIELERVDEAFSKVPLRIAEVSDEGGNLKGFRISIFNARLPKGELNSILQHELAHARLQSMGFLRLTGNVPLKLANATEADLHAINRLISFPWEYYSTLLHAKHFPKECKQMALKAFEEFKEEPKGEWPRVALLLQLLLWSATCRAMDWRGVGEEAEGLIASRSNDWEREKIQAFRSALERMPALPQGSFETSSLKTVLRALVDALNQVFKDVLEKPLEVPAGLTPTRPVYIG